MIEQEAEKILKQVQNDRGGESGRTMTEMLAVIGIIGVLSVGGMTLGGYVIGGIKANRVVSGLQERILLAQKRRIVGQSLSFRKRRIEESIMGLYPVEYKTGETDEENSIYYGKKITVSEIPQQVCEGLKKDASLQATLDEVGGIISFNDGGEDGACQEENNKFFVLFGGRSEGKCHGVKNGCMICDEASGEWEIDETMDGEPIDICHICSNGNIVAKEKGKVVPCGKDCCTLFETCDAEEGCVTRCPANSSYNNFSGDQIGDSDCYCNAGYRVDAFQTGCVMDCGEHGTLSNDTCVCCDNYYGDYCENAPLNCENGGTWNNQTNSCDCVGAYAGIVCTDRACSTNNDCTAYLGSGYVCNTKKGICEIQCASNTTYVDNFGCCKNDALWNGGCCAENGAKIQEVDGILVCYSGLTKAGCPEGQIYDSKTGTCINCADVTGVIRNGFFSNCSICPNLVKVSKWQCAPTCTDPDAVLVGGQCKCPLDRPLLPSNNPANPQCLPCEYNGQTGQETAYGNINTGYYCNRRNGGGYSNYCAPGTVGLSNGQSIILKDGSTYKETNNYGSCKPCGEVDVAVLKYQASCLSCGGTWVGESWDNGTCQP